MNIQSYLFKSMKGHNPKFIIDEKAMLTGSKVFVQLIEDLLMK